jgi:hypothetical protein
MKTANSNFVVIITLIGAIAAGFTLTGCGKSDSTSGGTSGGGSGGGEISGVYTSLDSADLTIQFKSGGVVVFTAKDTGTSEGTYTVSGEKIIVDVKGMKSTFIRDGDCIKDNLDVYGTLCKGGKAGAAANVSTRSVPTAPSGVYVATNEDGTFKIEFKPGNKLTFSAMPAAGVPGKPEVHEGTVVIEGDQLHVKLDDSTPLVLQFVNNTYESTSFGIPMKFVKQ